MQPILFYGVPSGCSFGSIVALEWLGQPYRLCRIEMPAVVSGEAFRRINPAGETPSLMTASGQVIHESLAILNHLAARGIDQGLGFEQGTPGFDRFNQVLAFLNTSFFSAFSPLWYAYEHELGTQAKDALTAFGAAKVKKAHANLDALLGEQDWLLGSQRSFADAYFYGIARWSRYHQVLDRSDYPNLQRLFARLEQDPGVRFALAIEAGDEAVSAGAYAGDISLEEVLSTGLLKMPQTV